eukprot:Tbor_TRINITY_DN2641_c0_g1::TRINITY_DN2641_c0_g1_i1::g.17976::m.17976
MLSYPLMGSRDLRAICVILFMVSVVQFVSFWAVYFWPIIIALGGLFFSGTILSGNNIGMVTSEMFSVILILAGCTQVLVCIMIIVFVQNRSTVYEVFSYISLITGAIFTVVCYVLRTSLKRLGMDKCPMEPVYYHGGTAPCNIVRSVSRFNTPVYVEQYPQRVFHSEVEDLPPVYHQMPSTRSRSPGNIIANDPFAEGTVYVGTPIRGRYEASNDVVDYYRQRAVPVYEPYRRYPPINDEYQCNVRSSHLPYGSPTPKYREVMGPSYGGFRSFDNVERCVSFAPSTR